MSKISIAMATYNGEAFLSTQLESLAEQSQRPTELVVVDDASSDGTFDILDDFRRKSPFPVTLHQNTQRLGYREGFIKAARMCSSEIIAFCDQDDIWSSVKIETLQQAFDQNPQILLVYHNSMIVNETGRALTTIFPRHAPSLTIEKIGLSPCMVIPGHAQAFRRSLNLFSELHADSLDPYTPAKLMPHDMWMPFWASSIGQIRYLSNVLVDYRMHSTNTSGWHISWWSFAADHIRNARMYVRANETIAQNRGTLLRYAQALLQKEQISSLDDAAKFYEGFGVNASERALIYTQPSIVKRAQAFFAFAFRKNYKRGSRCHGFDALLLDLVVGVIFGGLAGPQT